MDKIIVGKIINTHGVRGELKVDRTNNETFDRPINYFVGDDFEQINISNSRLSGKLAYIKIEGLDNINLVLKYKTKFIYINKEDLYALDEDEYYIKDLIGLEVKSSTGEEIGVIKDVLSYAANDVYIFEANNDEQIMIPAVKEFVKEIDLKSKVIIVDLIEGM